MAVTFPLASPHQWGLGSATWRPSDNISIAFNPWTGQALTQVFDGYWWAGEISIVPDTEAEGRRLAAWLTALHRSGTGTRTFLFEGPARPVPLGSAATTPGTPVINGADQTGESLNIDGLPISATGYLKAGDFIQIGTGAAARLKMVLDDVSSNGAGEATLTVWPPVRVGSAPADGSAVVVEGAQGVFLALGKASEWQPRPGNYLSATIACREKF